MPRPKVILDTNLFMAAYFNKNSHSAKILKLASLKKIQVFWNKRVKRELYIILRNIHARKDYYELIDKIFTPSGFVIKTPRLNLIKVDYSDNEFLGLAQAAKADYIVTNDYHLLKFKRFKKTKIVKPRDFFIFLLNP